MRFAYAPRRPSFTAPGWASTTQVNLGGPGWASTTQVNLGGSERLAALIAELDKD
jgi:hypothetical protein